MVKETPHNLEAEQAVLGSVLVDPSAIDIVAAALERDDFYHQGHRIIFSTMLAQALQGEPIDFTTTITRLRTNGELEKVGGPAYLGDLFDSVVTSSNVNYHCRLVKSKAIARKVIDAARQIATAATSTEDPDALLAIAFAALEKVGTAHRQKDDALLTLEHLADLYEKHVNTLDKTRFITGFPDLDGIIRGCAPGETMFIQAYSGLYKSAVLQNMLLNACNRTDLHHLFFSLEMPGTRVFERTVQIGLETLTYRVESGFHHHAGYKEKTLEELRNLKADKLIVCDQAGLTIERIEHYTRLARQRYGQLGAIGIDYMGLMGADNAKSEYERISYVAENSKHLAKRLNLPVIVLTQINRTSAAAGQVEKFSGKGSGAIEASADYLIGLQKDEQKNLVLKLLKNRNGEENLSFLVDMHAPHLKIRGLSPYDQLAAKNAERGKSRLRKGYMRDPENYDPYE
ncbi:MAG: hypothetical protein CXR31_04495 [Geobacter sp.]|nr:MAG: hypothetical protein CXR31_04495 [Geobacter sp.]